MTPATDRAQLTDVHVIAHTHWDREWYLTREQYRLRLVDLIDGVLERMQREPDFRYFHLDGQTIVLEDYLEVRPEQAATLRERIQEGRLLVGPWYVMPDMHLVSGESLVRNLALGHRIAEGFGGVMRVGYMPDPFGHVAQMPQILAGFGLDSAVLWRGFAGEKAEYGWQALDGTLVTLFHLPREGYCNALWLPLLPEGERAAAADRLVARERARSASGSLLFMAGVDHVEPAPALLDLCKEIDRLPGVSARLSTLPEYVAAAQAALRGLEGTLQGVRGELRAGEDYAPLLPGVLSARVYLKQANARVQGLLERRAEPAAAFASLLGAGHAGGILGYAWRTLLQNHPHDSICGCSLDAVHAENETRFARASEAAAGVEQNALQAIANALASPPPGTLRLIAVNTDLHEFDGVTLGDLEVAYEVAEPGRRVDPAAFERPLTLFPPDAVPAAVTGPDDEPVPFQLLGHEDRLVHFMSRFEPPLAVRARVWRIAVRTRVPACGFVALDVRFGAAEGAAAVGPQASFVQAASEPNSLRRASGGSGGRDHSAPLLNKDEVTAGDSWLENERLRVDVNADGTLDARDKLSGQVLRRVLDLEDGGDVGDEYNYDRPARDRLVTSREAADVCVTTEHAGPLVAALRIRLQLALPAGASPDRADRAAEAVSLPVSLLVRLAAGSRRVEVELRLENRARDHRLHVLFPTGAAHVIASRADSAFGVVEREARRSVPERIKIEAPVSSAPLHSFVDAGDAASGVSVLSEGLVEYEVVGEAEARVALTLLRCVSWLSRDDLQSRRGHAGPGLETPQAQCLGSHVFRFAFAPRAAPPGEADLYRESRAFLAPPRLFGPAGREGRLPLRHQFLEVACEPRGSVVLSALKRADERDALIVRLFNPGDAPASATIGVPGGLSAACRTDLRELDREPLALADGRVTLRLEPRKIGTISLTGTS